MVKLLTDEHVVAMHASVIAEREGALDGGFADVDMTPTPYAASRLDALVILLNWGEYQLQKLLRAARADRKESGTS